MKRYLVILLIAIVSLPACKKEEQNQTEFPCTPCSPEREYYFTGIVLDECRCLNAGNYHYQVSSGGVTTDEGKSLSAAIDTYPLHVGDKSIHVNSSFFEPNNYDQFLEAYTLGFKEFRNIHNPDVNGFSISYSICTFFEDWTNYERDYYNTSGGDQIGSTLELVEFYKLQDSEYRYKLRFIINCKLYDINGNYAGVIEDGDIVSRVAF